MPLRLATRRSPLAQAQAELVREQLSARGVSATLVFIETEGDRNLDTPLRELGGQGVFAVGVQAALLDGRADVAVHSAKDLPSETPDGLLLACVPERRSATDVLVGRSLAGLGPGATVATGSPRRRALLLERRPDLNIVELRGNMATRLAKAGHDGVDAIVTATAALSRLERQDLIAEELDAAWFVPQVGQGAIALECRRDDGETQGLLVALDDAAAHRTLDAERAFLRELGAGCSIPVGAHATMAGDEVHLRGVMVAFDGSSSVRGELNGHDADAVGAALARQLRDVNGGASLPGWSR